METREEMIADTLEIAKRLSSYGVLKLWMVAKYIRDQENMERGDKEK